MNTAYASMPQSAGAGTGPKVVVLGGSGFVGRQLAGHLHESLRVAPLYIIHRSTPEWLRAASIEVHEHALDDRSRLLASLEGAQVVINLLRPDGSGWYLEMLHGLLATIAAAKPVLFIHASSIDVYGETCEAVLDEESLAMPDTPYAKEHLAAEGLILSMPHSIVLRLGAVFGPGGRNVVAFAREAAEAPSWRIAARRMLYGRRRMHLVSVEAVCSVLAQLAQRRHKDLPRRLLVTDDHDERNNFAFLCDVLTEAWKRPDMRRLPFLPIGALKFALALRGRPTAMVERRFSDERLHALGLSRPDFGTCLAAYAHFLASQGAVPH
jgi:nucleoside-diphosphate-sugar epimerase